MKWENDQLVMLDQTLLPTETKFLRLGTPEEVAEAIQKMIVRGAPAIGIAAGYGMALAAKHGANLQVAGQLLVRSRPTAVNLKWAVERILSLDTTDPERILLEAKQIEAEDLEMNRKIGKNGAVLIPDKSNVLTICNTGALATAGHGTALGIIRSAHEQGKQIHVWSCETRPRMQGLKLTAYELSHENIPFHSISDATSGMLMAQKKVDCVIAGADRIASNGDSANKIGTYTLAVLAKYHEIPFYIAAPSSTLDLNMLDGSQIPIEERHSEEILRINQEWIAPSDTPVFNPGFDITPGNLISAIITEDGIMYPPYCFLSN